MSGTRSDLAAECTLGVSSEGVRHCEVTCEGCRIFRVRICSDEAAQRVGKPKGHYVTLECGDVWALDEREMASVRRALAVELRDMLVRALGGSAPRSVLVAGLGNAELTPDAVGPLTVTHLFATRGAHTAHTLQSVCAISALSVGVSAKTGLETLEFLRGIVREIAPDAVLAVDALAARDPARLGCTVQLADTGICPGSGVDAARVALNCETLGVPVIALGVPTVVDSATLTLDVLERAGYAPDGDAMDDALRRARRFFVAPREIDLLVRASGLLLAGAIERALL